MSEAKEGMFKPLLKIHDDGEFLTLLNALGFTVDPNQAEMLCAIAKWHRMLKNKEKIEPLTIGNVNKFRVAHFEFLKNYRQMEQEAAMKKSQAEAQKRLQEQGENVIPMKP